MTDAPTVPAPPATAPASRLRVWVPVAVIGVLLVVAGVLGQSDETGLPLDPRSPDPAGTRALTLILSELGADVDVVAGGFDGDYDAVLVLRDNAGEAAAAVVRRQATRGATVVVTDPRGALTPRLRREGETGFVAASAPLRPGCPLAALRGVSEISVGASPTFRVPDGATGCFRVGDGAWLIARSVGTGAIVTTGSPDWVTNRGIRYRDNAVLAAALLAPRPGTRVAVVSPQLVASGAGTTTSLGDLIPVAVRLAVAQLVVAFGLVVVWRARRLGMPLSEAPRVPLPGSELVIAVGNLLHRTGAVRRAADVLRAELRGLLSRRVATDPHDTARLADAITAHSGVDRAAVLDALDGPHPTSDDELVLLAQRVEDLRHRVLVPSTTGDDRVGNV